MKTEDELLGLLAKTYELDSISYIKDYLADNFVSGSGFLDKEKFIAELERGFNYNEMFSVWTEAVVHPATAKRMAYVSLVQDNDERHRSYVVIESENGLITKIFYVYRHQTNRRLFQRMKQKFFDPAAEAPEVSVP